MITGIVDNETSEINIEITVNKNGEMYKHVIRGYELVAIQKDPKSGQIAFVTQKPSYTTSTWTLAQFTNFELDDVEQMQPESLMLTEPSDGGPDNVRSTAG